MNRCDIDQISILVGACSYFSSCLFYVLLAVYFSFIHIYVSVLIAEIIKAFIPNIVDLHNYPAALATDKKATNWALLNR